MEKEIKMECPRKKKYGICRVLGCGYCDGHNMGHIKKVAVEASNARVSDTSVKKTKKAKTLEEINALIPKDGLHIETLFPLIDLRIFHGFRSKGKFIFDNETRKYFKNERG